MLLDFNTSPRWAMGIYLPKKIKNSCENICLLNKKFLSLHKKPKDDEKSRKHVYDYNDNQK